MAINKAVGQDTPTIFVMRTYEETSVRIRLTAFAEVHDPDNIVGHAVDVRVGDPDKVGDCRYWSNIFGAGPSQYENASAAFYKVVGNYVKKGILP